MLIARKLCVKSAAGLHEKQPHVRIYGYWGKAVIATLTQRKAGLWQAGK